MEVNLDMNLNRFVIVTLPRSVVVLSEENTEKSDQLSILTKDALSCANLMRIYGDSQCCSRN
jgi:hypothetical protein